MRKFFMVMLQVMFGAAAWAGVEGQACFLGQGGTGMDKAAALWRGEFPGLYTGRVGDSDRLDLSKWRYLVLDSGPVIDERFARRLEEWVWQGGRLIVTGLPTAYGKGGNQKPFCRGRTSRDNLLNAILRPISVAPSGSIQAKTVVWDGAALPCDLKLPGIKLVTGWPDATLDNMTLATAKAADGSQAAVATWHVYGRGLGVYTTLPVNQDNPLADTVRKFLANFAVNRPALPPANVFERPRTLAHVPGTDKLAEEPAPTLPAPDKSCVLEIHGDQFVGDYKGSPSWQPYRVGWTYDYSHPLKHEFELPAGAGPLWMEVKAAYGDHCDAPVVEALLNGKRLLLGQSPWERIQYSPQFYDAMRPVRFFIPAAWLGRRNVLEFVNRDGADWWLLHYVRFYRAEGKDSLEDSQTRDQPEPYELKATAGEPDLDGKLDAPAWRQADWKCFPDQIDGRPTEFALLSGKDCLFVGFKMPWRPKEKVEDVAEFAVGQHLFSAALDGKGGIVTSLRDTDGDVLLGAGFKAAGVQDAGLCSIELAIPWNLLPLRASGELYRPKTRLAMPFGNLLEGVNAYRRSQSGDNACWLSWLPFEFQGRQTTKLEAQYKVKTEYHHIYHPVVQALAYNLGGDADAAVVWPDPWRWGANSVRVSLPEAATAEATIMRAGTEAEHLTFDVHRDKTLRLPLLQPGPSTVSLAVRDAAGKLLALKSQEAKTELPFKAKLNRSYYTKESRGAVVLELFDPAAFASQVDRIEAEVELPGSEVASSSLSGDALKGEGRLVLPLDISALPLGRFPVSVQLVAGGKRLRLADLTLEKLPPAPVEAKLRADGTLEVNDKPVFPFGLMLNGLDTCDRVSDITAGGFNLAVALGGLFEDAPEKRAQYLEDAANAGVWLIVNPTGAQNGAGHWQIDYDKTAREVKELAPCPALLGYYPIDEPEYYHAKACTPQKLDEFNRFVKKLDPYRPNMISHGVGSIHYGRCDGVDFNGVVDIRVWECYGGPEDVFRKLDQMAGDGKCDRAVSWTYLKGGSRFNFSGYSPLEFRASVYASLVGGAKGIILFELQSFCWTGHEIYPHATAEVAGELSKLSETILKEGVEEFIPEAKGARARAWRDGEDTLLLVVNPADAAATAEIAMPLDVPRSLKPLFPSMPVALGDGRMLKVELAPYGVAAYRWHDAWSLFP